MNTRLLSVLTMAAVLFGSLVCSATAAPATPTKDQLTKIFKEGEELFQKRQWSESERRFRYVVKHVPNHPQSQRYLNKIRIERQKEASVPSMYRDLSKITIDKVSIDDATLEEALEFVTIRTKAISGGKLVPNFVLRDKASDDKDNPAAIAVEDSFAKRKLTLNLNKIPVSALLDIIGKSTKVKFTFEKYAIIGTPTADPRAWGVAVVSDQKTAPSVRGR